MFDYPLLEVIQAIEKLQESRGKTNKQICDFVRKRAKDPNDPMKVLKTVQTLNKLVEEGVLVKKGKRYLFPNNKNSDEDKEEEEEDCEDEQKEEDCEEEDENQDEDEDCDEENENENDEDEDDANNEPKCSDDDDDDDDDEEDDDDDDSESCDDKDKKPDNATDTADARGSSSKPTKNGKLGKMPKDEPCDETEQDVVMRDLSAMKNENKPYEGRSSMRRNKDLDEIPMDGMTGRRESRCKRKTHEYRSRSPIRKGKDKMYHTLNFGISEEMGSDFINSDCFQEGDMDVDTEKENDADGVLDVLRHRSPLGPPPPNTPGVHVDQKESCCSQVGKMCDTIKAEPGGEGEPLYTLKKKVESKSSLFKVKEKNRENKDKEMSPFDESNEKDVKFSSMCSFCDKKKRSF